MNKSSSESNAYRVEELLDNGIERIAYIPERPRRSTPILFLHGMWHGAWCWSHWQEMFAELGWESHAISLPGHGGSESRGSNQFKTMGQYLSVLGDVIASFPKKPILVGHSMGGALAQWYLKRMGDDLPAVVFVASWTSHSTFTDGTALHLKRDPIGFFLAGLTMSSTPFIRNPEVVESMLISGGALYSGEELKSKLVKESGLVLSQHNPPLWSPRRGIKTPSLWVAAEKDAVITIEGARKSAEFYGSDYIEIPGSAHNLMMERSYRDTASRISQWLTSKVTD